MAVRNYVSSPIYPGMTIKLTWSGLLNGDSGQPAAYTQFPIKTMTIAGTFGVAGNILMEGSNDEGATWFVLSDLQGVALGTLTAAAMKTVRETPALMRPRVTGGDGATSLRVDIVCVSNSSAS